MANYIIVWYWTEAWRCKCVTFDVQDPKKLTEDPQWMEDKTILGVYDTSNPVDTFRLGGAVEDCTTSWKAVSQVLQQQAEALRAERS